MCPCKGKKVTLFMIPNINHGLSVSIYSQQEAQPFLTELNVFHLLGLSKEIGNQPKMPVYKLTYFDLRALAEPIRWIFVIAGVPFEDNRIQFDEWPALKKSTGWGKIPLLEIDGKELTQTIAIARYLAKKFDLIPTDDFEAATCDEVVCAIDDITNAWRPYVLEKDEEIKALKKKTLLEGLVANYLPKINQLVEANKNNYVVGEKLSWADLVLANYLEIFEESLDPQIMNTYPALKRQRETVFAIPQIKEWVAKRPKSWA